MLLPEHSMKVISLSLLVLVCRLAAQDTRTVVEPHFPPVCRTLTARLSAPGGTLPEASERALDTARIQAAIDECTAGKAVELKAAGAQSIFLAGPFALKPGVTLLIDAGAALIASRDPRLYDLTPGSCGLVNERGHGCRPLITADQAPGAAIMGDGVIDGRGGASILGQNASWWDLAHEAKIKDLQQSVPRILVIRQSFLSDKGSAGLAEWRAVISSGEFRSALWHTAQISLSATACGASSRTCGATPSSTLRPAARSRFGCAGIDPMPSSRSVTTVLASRQAARSWCSSASGESTAAAPTQRAGLGSGLRSCGRSCRPTPAPCRQPIAKREERYSR